MNSLDEILTKLENWTLASTDGGVGLEPFDMINHKEAKLELLKLIEAAAPEKWNMHPDDTYYRTENLRGIGYNQAIKDYLANLKAVL